MLLVNVGLAIYFNLDTITGKPVIKPNAEINPDKLVLLTQQALEAKPKREPTQAAATLQERKGCHAWTGFSLANVAAAQSELAKLSLTGEVKVQASDDPEHKRYWVYRPPMASFQQALDKVAELRALGVQEMMVVQDPKWKNAISFGLFRDEQLAKNLLEDVRAKGVKTVTMTLRNQGKDTVSLILHDVTDMTLTELENLRPNFPETELIEIACPTGQ